MSLLKLGQLNPWGVCLEKKVKKYTTQGEYSFFPNQVTDVMSTLGCKAHKMSKFSAGLYEMWISQILERNLEVQGLLPKLGKNFYS